MLTLTTKPARQVSPAGLTAVKHLECKDGIPDLVAFQDQGGVWTIGYGHTGDDVYKGVTCTPEAAEQMLDTDLDKVEFAICKHTDYHQFTDNEFDALAILLFNAGVGVLDAKAFAAAVKPDPKTGLINKGNVAKQFPKWVWVTDRKTGKKFISNGLVNRRAAELQMWNTPDTVIAPIPLAALPVDVQPPVPELVQVSPMVDRVQTATPTIAIPEHSSGATPTAPPATVAQAPGGKSLIVTVGGLVVGAISQGYDQIIAAATQISRVKDGLADAGTWGHVAGVAICAGIVGIAIFTYWMRHREVKSNAG